MRVGSVFFEPYHGGEPVFFNPGDKFPYHIDANREAEARDKEPIDPWNWGHFKGKWYPLADKYTREERCEVILARKEWGVQFRDRTHFLKWLDEENAKYEHIKHKCPECDYETKNLDALKRHEGTNSCRIRKLKMEARANKKVYIPPHRAKHYCDACNADYANRHAFLRHLKSKAHREKTNPDPIPTKCLVCDIAFTTPLKTKRHLKTSKKCHRKALADNELLTQYFYMVDRFGCKFDRNTIYLSAKCRPCSPKEPEQAAPKVLVV